MKTVVLFKSYSEEYKKVFHDNHYKTVFIEPLQFTHMNLEELNTKLQQDDYDGVIFTSPRAIEAAANCWEPSKFVIWNRKRVYTVGEMSSQKIRLLLGLDAIGATSGNVKNLAHIIIGENLNISKFLFPCGNLTLETLPNLLQEKDITVDSVTVYETKENENLKSELMKLSDYQDICCMVFFSPSGCEYVHRQLQTYHNKLFYLPHFAIGNTTAHKIENLGLEIAGVAAKPTPESVVESIQKYFTSTET